MLSYGFGSATTSANGDSDLPAISAEGSAVAFVRVATDFLHEGFDADGSQRDRIYYRLGIGVPLPVSVAWGGLETGDGAVSDEGFAISASGERVVHSSLATNVVTGQADGNGGLDVLLWTRTGAGSTLVSRADGETTQTGNDASSEARLSADGNVVVFSTDATDLVDAVTDDNSNRDVFRWSTGGFVELVSHAFDQPLATATTGASTDPLVSSNGAYVAFTSQAVDLVEGDGNSQPDAFCFGPEELFTDGFESGTPDRWSDAVN